MSNIEIEEISLYPPAIVCHVPYFIQEQKGPSMGKYFYTVPLWSLYFLSCFEEKVGPFKVNGPKPCVTTQACSSGTEYE